jgi:hypothetical protein
MTMSQWLGIGGFVILAGIIALAFRQGSRVKLDRNRRTEDHAASPSGGDHGSGVPP